VLKRFLNLQFTQIISLIAILYGVLGAYGQNWSNDLSIKAGFVENNTRFESIFNKEVKFYTEKDGYTYFFTETSIIVGKRENPAESNFSAYKEEVEHSYKITPRKWDYFELNFLNANTTCSILGQDKMNHTVNFQSRYNNTQTLKSAVFTSLLYNNVYEGIDVLIESVEKGGIKYSFLVKSGADVAVIQCQPTHISVQKNADGAIELQNDIFDFLEHAPVSMQGMDTIPSTFLVNDQGVISYELDDYDTLSDLVIDPWLVPALSFENVQKGYDVSSDYAGNSAVLGDLGNRVAFYNTLGGLEWVWISPGDMQFYYGDISTNPYNGDIFYNFPLRWPGIQDFYRINTDGAVEASDFYTPLEGDPHEMWRTDFVNSRAELLVGAGGFPTDRQLTLMDYDLTETEVYTVMPTPPGSAADPSLIEVDPLGDYGYVLISRATEEWYYNNQLTKFSLDDPTSIIWTATTDHGFVEISSIKYCVYTSGPETESPNGFNGLTCGYSLYSYDGHSIYQWDKETGELLNENWIDDVGMFPTPFYFGGIDRDPCGEVYVGVVDSMNIYDEDLAYIESWSVKDTVFDINITKENIFISGNDFVQKYELDLASLSIVQNPDNCGPCAASLTAVTSNVCPDKLELASINWSPSGATTATANDLCTGWHTATVLWVNTIGDTIARVDSFEVVSETPGVLTIDIADAACSGICSGAITLNMTGGIAPFNYDIGIESNGTGVFTELCSGSYPIEVTDAAGCTLRDTVIITADVGPTTSVVAVNNPTCHGFSDGSITVNATSLVGDVSYEWIPENAIPGNNTNNTLPGGIYTVVVTDGSDCVDTVVIELSDPDPITVELEIKHNKCYGDANGEIEVTNVIGAQGDLENISYVWIPNLTGVNGLGENRIEDLPAGVYQLALTDDYGCAFSQDIEISEPDSLYFSELGKSDAFCRLFGYQSGNGVVYAAASGGMPNYEYQWRHLETGTLTSNSTWGGLNPGTYEVKVRDENGCIIKEIVQVDSLNPIANFILTSAQLDGLNEGTEVAQVNLVNTSENFANPNNPLADTTFFWNLNHDVSNWQISHDYFEQFDTAYTGEASYEICLAAINKNGCTDTTCQRIVVHKQPKFIAPNIFTAGNDGANDLFTFEFLTDGVESFTCTIVDRWGVEVEKLNAVTDGWNGRNYQDKPCAEGVYFYTYSVVFTNGTEQRGQGNVQLVRN
jgi:gliding motility-associated-like protein